MAERKGWSFVEIKEAIQQALEDTERFGPCFLLWADQEDRLERMRLQELHVFRTVRRQPEQVAKLQILEWTTGQRLVKDFEHFQVQGASGARVVAATAGPDPRGTVVRKLREFVDQEVCEVVILEGPTEVAWQLFRTYGEARGWRVAEIEFLTSELGESRVSFAHHGPFEEKEVEELLAKTVTPPSLGTILAPGKEGDFVSTKQHWDKGTM